MNRRFTCAFCIGATILVFLGLVVVDIAVVETIFRPSNLWGMIWMWNIVFRTVLIVVPLVTAWRMRSHFPLYIPLLSVFGLEDTAFYSLQLKWPAYYVGVSVLGIWQPDSSLALMLNLLGVTMVAIIELVYHHFSYVFPNLGNFKRS